jgi:hypothetical protein
MKPVAWIKIRELSYMKAVAQHGKDDWQTNLGLKPEPDDEGLYTETQVQRMIDAAVHKEREACARLIDGMADDMEREMESSYAIAWVRSKAAAIRARAPWRQL